MHETPQQSQGLTASDLLPVVQQVLGEPVTELLHWQNQKLAGGAGEHFGFGLGIYRIAGAARYDGRDLPWSVILKLAGPSTLEMFNEPNSPEYWKREVLAFQSGILDDLPPCGLVAVRCYGVDELADGTYRMWLEDVREMEGDWSMEHHHLAARHLGQFNGAYLAGYPLPKPEPWMLPAHLQHQTRRYPPDKELLLRFSETELGRWLPNQNVERMFALWDQRAQLFDVVELLPTCYCHFDASRRNMMLRGNGDGELETVAIDWQKSDPGRIGQEIAVTTSASLFFADVSAARAGELDDAIFTGYCAGLRDAGWQGDPQLARFGYATTAALLFGVVFAAVVASGMVLNSPTDTEPMTGLPIDFVLDQWEVVHPFLLDLGDEALELLPAVRN